MTKTTYSDSQELTNINEVPFPVYDGGLRFLEQTRRVKKWPINNKMIVADVGCGHSPFPYANILIDKNVADCNERFGLPIPRDGRAILEADVEKGLPFKSKEIDFLYCSHTLEHCSDPAFAIKEIMRVARAGFIETPNVVFELLLGLNDNVHKWVTEYNEEKKIIIFRKLNKSEVRAIERRMELGDIFSKVFRDPVMPSRFHMTAYWKNQDLFTNCFLWKDSINFSILQ